MRKIVLVGLLLILRVSAFGRLGETGPELIKRFGEPDSRGAHKVLAQGKLWVLGPTLNFHQDDWSISCDLVDGRVVRISYRKRGEWTEEQLQLVLASNSQGAKWTESKPSPLKLTRNWKRTDGAVADWLLASGMNIVVPAYDHAKAVVEAKAKAEVSKKPKI